MKKYYRRSTDNAAYFADDNRTAEFPSGKGTLHVAHACVINETECCSTSVPERKLTEICDPLSCINDVVINPDIGPEQRKEMLQLINSCDIFSTFPGQTHTIVHDILVSTTEPIKPKIYPVPAHLESHFRAEIEKLLNLGIIQPSDSPYRSPVVMVKKNPNSNSESDYRMTIDYRSLNAFTVFNAELSCNIEDDLHKFFGSKYYSDAHLPPNKFNRTS